MKKVDSSSARTGGVELAELEGRLGGKGAKNGKTGKLASRREAEVDPNDTAEHLIRELARVRAKFGVDPVLAQRSLASAWASEWNAPAAPIEEDEAEFVDVIADCLGAGLPLDAALDCWDSGDLVAEASDDSAAADDESPPPPIPVTSSVARHPSGRRLVVR